MFVILVQKHIKTVKCKKMKINYKEYLMKELDGLLENIDKKEDSELIAETTAQLFKLLSYSAIGVPELRNKKCLNFNLTYGTSIEDRSITLFLKLLPNAYG
jgi:hypothetical protein